METSNPIDAELGLISEQAYADFVGKTLPSVRNERHLGRGCEFVRLGRTVKYRLDAVRRYVEANTIRPGKSAPTLINGEKRRPRRKQIGARGAKRS